MTSDADVRKNLIRRNIERIEHAYVAAVNAGDPDPAVLLLDLRDDLARRIAANALSRTDIDGLVAEKGRSGLIPTLCFPCSRQKVSRAFG